MWCQAPSGGFASRNDPQTATIGDFGVDMAARGLAFTPKASVKRADTESGDTRPGLTSAKLAATAQVVAIPAGILAVGIGLATWRNLAPATGHTAGGHPAARTATEHR